MGIPLPPSSSTPSMLVEAPARLHLGFLDPDATLGRRFASLGLVIDGLGTRLEVAPAEANEVELAGGGQPDLRERLAVLLERLQADIGLHRPLRVTVHRAPPAHAGFGSGTQLALALGRAFAASHRLDLDTRRIAALLGRGKRSGVGIAGFDRGGLLLDGGPGAGAAPLLARVDFPRAWRVLLVLDPRLDGLHGSAENAAMGQLPPFPRPLAADLCHQVLMRVLPAALEADFEPFAAGVSAIQQAIGDYFAPAQGGSMYTSPAVAQVLEWVRPRYRAGIGQSSWGPTGFAILPSGLAAQEVVAAARAAGVVAPHLQLLVVAGRNQGARLTALRSPWLVGRSSTGPAPAAVHFF